MEKNRWLWDQGQIDDDEKEETVLMQKAVASVVTSDEFQGLLKKIVKVALDERTQEENQRALALEIARGDKYNQTAEISEKSEQVLHYLRHTWTRTACGLDRDEASSTMLESWVTCKKCKAELKPN